MAEESEKKEVTYSVRISSSLKAEIDLLSETFKHQLIEETRLLIKKKIHESKFDPRIYP